MIHHTEPYIVINGVALTEGQAMTVRVALGVFAMDLKENGCGDDEHGKAMSAGYTDRLDEIFRIIAPPSTTTNAK